MGFSLFALLLAIGVTDLFISTRQNDPPLVPLLKVDAGSYLRIHCSSLGIELLDRRVKRVVSYRKKESSS